MKRQPPFDPAIIDPIDGIYNTDPDAPYVNGDPRIGRRGSIPPFEAVDHPQREIVEVIEWSGQTPDHEDLEQLRKALQWLVGERLVKSAGGAIAVYGGIDEDDDAHVIRSIEAGSNVTVDLVEAPPGSGLHKIRISSTAGGGVGGAGDPLVNIGDGAQVYKGNITDQEQLRSLKGINGIVVTQNANDITFDGSALGGGGGGEHESGDVIIRQRRFFSLAQSVNYHANSPTTAWTQTITPKGVGNTLFVRADLHTGVDSTGATFTLSWRPAGGVWATLQTRTLASAVEGGVNQFVDLMLRGEITVPAGPVNIELKLVHVTLTAVPNYVMGGSSIELLEYQDVV